MIDEATAESFWAKVNKDSGCWEWTGALASGYGVFYCEGRNWKAHRLSWLIAGKELDPNLCLDHLCKNRKCVNPSHLDQVTLAENTRRSDASMERRTRRFCRFGHPIDGFRRQGEQVIRECRTCKNESSRRYKAKM